MPRLPIKLRISKTVFGGDGLAELSGKAVFVEGALPGESVEAEILEDQKNFLRARLVRVLEPSPARVEPPCPHAFTATGAPAGRTCGGCQYQHVSYEEELKLKEGQLKEILERAGIAALPEPIVRSDRPFGYRSSVTLHPLLRSASRSSGGQAASTRLGLFARDNRTVIPVKNCLIADPAFEKLFTAEVSSKKCPERVTFKLDESGRVVDDLKESFLRMRLSGENYLVHASGFFQTNPFIASKILERVTAEAAGLRPEVFADLFAGVGTFGLAAAPHCASVVCVEESPHAFQALEMNIAERGLAAKVRAIRGRAEKNIPDLSALADPRRALIVVDPPRAGLERSLAEHLAACPAGKILYISCDPVTLARDLALFEKQKRWTIASITPYDMFPKTAHLESLTVLNLR